MMAQLSALLVSWSFGVHVLSASLWLSSGYSSSPILTSTFRVHSLVSVDQLVIQVQLSFGLRKSLPVSNFTNITLITLNCLQPLHSFSLPALSQSGLLLFIIISVIALLGNLFAVMAFKLFLLLQYALFDCNCVLGLYIICLMQII